MGLAHRFFCERSLLSKIAETWPVALSVDAGFGRVLVEFHMAAPSCCPRSPERQIDLRHPLRCRRSAERFLKPCHEISMGKEIHA